MKEILVLAILFSISFIILIIFLIYKQKLKEQYSLLWLLLGISMIILSCNPSWLDTMAQWLNIIYAPALLFLVGIIFCLILILHLTIAISKLSDQIIRLTQEIALQNIKHKNKKE